QPGAAGHAQGLGGVAGRLGKAGEQGLHHLAPASGQPQVAGLRSGMDPVAARTPGAGEAPGGGDRRRPGQRRVQRQRLQAALRGGQVSEVLALARELIARRSVTPDDAGCQDLVARRLARAGFSIEWLDAGDVRNLWATHGRGGEVFCLLGHTDVVPPGPREAWESDPFVPEVRDGLLHGRGAADMKGSVAAFVVALERFVAAQPDHPGTVALLLTSDEEGDAIDGVRRVAEPFRARGQRIDWCITGEPSSTRRLGDLLRVGRRGSLSAALTVRGVQGHVAYPEQARNPVHLALPALAELVAR